ncbi:MAG: ATP-binding protein [Ignavibacteriales bacterium]|nr:ATP-binding protein [Ignavibacteriales bacterium]
MAIVKKILEVHEVEISTTSAPNKGTTFSFDIPVYKSKNQKSINLLDSKYLTL